MANTTNAAEIIRIGDQLGITLPPDAVAGLKAKAGDSVSVRSTADGIEIRALTEHERQLLVAEKIMAERHDLLRRLAE